MRIPVSLVLPALAVLLVLTDAHAMEPPRAALPGTEFHFGKVVRGTVVEHDYTLINEGAALLELSRASMNAPLLATRLPRNVQPGSQATLRFRLDTSTLEGPFDGQITLFLNDPVLPEAHLTFEGEVVPGVEVSPMPAIFLVTQRGERKAASVELINHEPEPLRVLNVENAGAKLKTGIETLEQGRRYRLTVAVSGDEPAGKRSDSLIVKTSSRTTPTLTITANTYVRERVYTFPDAVDLGALRWRDLEADPSFLERVAQTLMVYQVGGAHFQVSLRTDLPALTLKSERGPAGDRWQITVGLNREKIQPGPIRGTLFIQTNDPKHRKLSVPVSGSILSL